MKFPTFLYRLLPGDGGQQQLQLVFRDSVNSAAAGTVTTQPYTVPGDKVLVLTNACARATAGAAQNANRIRLFVDPQNGTKRYELAALGSGSVGPPAYAVLNWTGEVVVPPGADVEAEAVFSAGVAANEINLEIFGYLVPRGTFIY